jgi:hypothetical protein
MAKGISMYRLMGYAALSFVLTGTILVIGCVTPEETVEGKSTITPAAAQEPAGSPPGSTTEPPSPKPVSNPMERLRELQREAGAKYSGIDSYIARLRRREQINGKDRPEEVLLFKFRKQPFSVYFKFLGDEGQGREVVYVKGQYGDMIHSVLAAGDVPFMPAGKRMSFAPDSILVRSASRHVITDAGIGEIIDRCGKILDAVERNDNRLGTIRYVGPVKRPEFDQLMEVAEHDLPPGYDAGLPRGGKRWIMFDPRSHLPVMLITHDETGHEVEYYCYDRLAFPVKLDDADFDPAKLWPASAKP